MHKDHKKTREEQTPYMRGVIAARQMICKGQICTNVSSKCLLLYYCCNADNNGEFFKSTLEICLETGLAASTVYALNAQWESWGLLKITKHDWRSGDANDYKINLKVLEEASDRTLVLKAEKITIAKQKAADRARKYRVNKKKAESASHGIVTPSR